jgi:hypothetical protein
MTTEVKEFTAAVFAKLDFSNPQNIRERVIVTLITALGELATWDKMIRRLQDKLTIILET